MVSFMFGNDNHSQNPAAYDTLSMCINVQKVTISWIREFSSMVPSIFIGPYVKLRLDKLTLCMLVFLDSMRI